MLLKQVMVKQGEYLFRYRSFLPLILLLTGLVVLYIESIGLSGPFYNELKWVGLVSGVTGLFIRITTVGYTPKNTSGRNTTEGQVADKLNTTGWYSIVRHPLYLGNFFMWLAAAIWAGNIYFVIVFSLVYWIYYERIMMAEEEFLMSKFKDAYLKWTDSTSAVLPTHFKWKKPNYKFSMKKVLAKEKNGLFALFTLLYLFTIVYDLRNANSLTLGWEGILFIVSGVIYLILKVMKRSGFLYEEGR